MPVSLSPSMIQGVVVAIIVFLIQLLFLEFLVLANANMQREISNHCDFGGFTTVKIRTGQTLANAGTVYTLKQSQTHPTCLLYTSPSPRDRQKSRMPSSA